MLYRAYGHLSLAIHVLCRMHTHKIRLLSVHVKSPAHPPATAVSGFSEVDKLYLNFVKRESDCTLVSSGQATGPLGPASYSQHQGLIKAVASIRAVASSIGSIDASEKLVRIEGGIY